ncbi:MAG: xylanase deacetylase, partial [Alicyclobacillus sp.]|nr:xylanase deacetylase [Alicyclobacillus sp.]
GFRYDSSLMGNDLHPYRPRKILEVNMDKGNVFGEPSHLIEIPVSWYLDDVPTQEFIPGIQEGLHSTEVIFDRWKAIFDYACDNEEGACYVLTIHPQTSGRAHMIPVVERLLEYMESRQAWFVTQEEICNAYTEDEQEGQR